MRIFPIEIINHILSFRPTHPVGSIIKQHRLALYAIQEKEKEEKRGIHMRWKHRQIFYKTLAEDFIDKDCLKLFVLNLGDSLKNLHDFEKHSYI